MHKATRYHNISAAIAVLVSIIFLAFASVAVAAEYKTVTIAVDGAVRQVNTIERTPEQILRQANVQVGPRDRVVSRTTVHGTMIEVIRLAPQVANISGKPVLKWSDRDALKAGMVDVVVEGKKLTVRAAEGASVRSVVINAGVNLFPLDRVSLVKISGKQAIQVQRVERKFQNKIKTIAAPVKKIEDKDLKPGQEKVVKAGKDGKERVTAFVETVDGKASVLSQKVIETVVAAEPKVLHVGPKTPDRKAEDSVPTVTAPVGESQSIAHSMVLDRGWDEKQFSCLVQLWNHESSWRTNAGNTASGAYGIPQALPGSKMASAGADWRTNPKTQITWGLGYISSRYGTPCGAWGHFQSRNWY